MKRVTFLLLAALIIGGSFSFLLIRLARVERENARQREQIALMGETATQARQAFNQILTIPEVELPSTTTGHFSDVEIRRFEKEFQEFRARVRQEEAYKQGVAMRLSTDLETLEAVSKER